MPLRFLFVLGAVAALFVPSAWSADSARGVGAQRAWLSLEDIYQIATARRRKIKNVRVSYEVYYRKLLDLPAYKAEGITVGTLPYRVLFAMDGERRKTVRQYILEGFKRPDEEWFKKGIDPVATTIIFDGVRSLTYRERGVAVIKKHKDPQCDNLEIYVPGALGVPVTDHDRASYDNWRWYPHTLRPEVVARAKYRVLPETEEVDGKPCHVVYAPGYDRLWIDPELGCAPRKRELYFCPEQPYLFVREYQSDFVESGGVLVPTTLRRELFAPLTNPKEYWNKVYLEMTVRVSKVEINAVTDEDFKAYLPPGTYVMDDVNNKAYMMPGEKIDALNELVAAGRKYLLDEQPPMGHTASLRILIIALNVLLLAVIALVVVRRRWRARVAAARGR